MKSTDVAVVGAGPAGISAALAAAGSGAQVLLIDERGEIGGQLRWRLSPTISGVPGLDLEGAPGPEIARALASRIASTANLTAKTGAVAWGLFENNVLGISRADGAEELQASAVVLATGSTDVTMPFPGWTLPGVMTSRAVQIFMHVHRVLPGRRWAILGDTPEAAELAEDIERAGGEIVVRLADQEDIRASGANRLAHVESGNQVYEIDGLAIALGRQPDAELALQAIADVRFDWALGGYTALRDANGETTIPGLYIAGDAAGAGSIAEAVAEGRLAGLAAAEASAAAIEEARSGLDRVATEPRRAAVERLRVQLTERAD